MVLDGSEPYALARFSDLQMLAVAAGGRERTEAEFQALFAAGGLRFLGKRPLPSVGSILEAAPAG
jgi:hypothetical protein